MKQPKPIVGSDTIAYWRWVNKKLTGHIGHSQIFSLLDSHETLRAQRDVCLRVNHSMGDEIMVMAEQFAHLMLAVSKWAMEHPFQAPTMTDLLPLMEVDRER